MIAGATASVYVEVNSPERPSAVVNVPTVDGMLEMHLTWAEDRPIVKWLVRHRDGNLFDALLRPKLEAWQQSEEATPTLTITEALACLLPIAQRWGRDPVPAITALIFWLQAELHAPGGIT